MSNYSDLFLQEFNEEKSTRSFKEPPQLTFFNGCFDKTQVKLLVSWFLNEYGEKKTIDFLEFLKYIGFHQATQAGISLGLEDLEIPPEKSFLISKANIEMSRMEKQNAIGSLTSVEKSQYLIDTWNQTSENLRQTAIFNFKNKNCVNPVYMMAFSGARGNISQVRQLVAMRGLMADPQGAILEFPIQSNFREGLTITEYLISCYGARKGLVDTALRTATSGYLTRRLVDSAQHAVISMTDCQTKNGIKLTGKNLTERLIGRVLAKSIEINDKKIFPRNLLISATIAKLITKNNDSVLVRSPLTCEAQTTVCQKCYGCNLATGKLVTLGDAVGVIAAQSIGEPGTQLTMRTFHTGGVGVFSDQSMKPIYAPYDGQIEFLENLTGHFVRTPHGAIRYILKYTSQNSSRILLRIRPLNSLNKEFTIKESELPSGSLLVAKQGEYIKTRQLIAQSARFTLTKQSLPESSHPVYSPTEGQIFFEYLHLKKESSLILKPGTPDNKILKKIGSFWILAGKNQSEVHNITSFLISGDLISPKTLAFQYNLYTGSQAFLKKFNEKLAIGFFGFQFPINTISFAAGFYRFNMQSTKSDFFVYKKITKNTFSESALIWYLNIGTRKPAQKLGYFYILSEYFTQLTIPNTENDLASSSNKFGLLTENYGSFYTLNQNIKKSNVKLSPNLQGFYLYSTSLKNEIQTTLCLVSSNISAKESISEKLNIKKLENPKIKKTNVTFKQTASFKLNGQGYIRKNTFKNLYQTRVQEKSGWIFLAKNDFSYSFSALPKRQFLKNGSINSDISIPSKPVAIEFIPFTGLKKSKSNYNVSTNLYTKLKVDFLGNNQKQKISPISVLQINNVVVDGHHQFENEKKSDLTKPKIWYKQNSPDKATNWIKFKKLTNKKQKNSFFINIQNINEYSLLPNKKLKNRWYSINRKFIFKRPTNPIFSKQKITKFYNSQPKIFNFYLQTPQQSDWFFNQGALKVHLDLPVHSYFHKNNLSISIVNNWFQPQLSLFAFKYLKLQRTKNFVFQTFQDNWVTPLSPFTKCYSTTKKLGEFHTIASKPNATILHILETQNFKSLKGLTTLKTCKIGNMIRTGDQLIPGQTTRINGQIIKLSLTNLTIRRGTPFLASARGLVHISQNELISKNQLLLTLKSRRLQTEDIVQGIPKIEQLFEARESQSGQILQDTVHSRLREYFVDELKKSDRSLAVQNSFIKAQEFLVQGILDAYNNQGVSISEKHVEVIVRQMTNRVRILIGGETGLLPGELINHNWIQKLNKQLEQNGLCQASYEPIVLGISKSVLQSESFLLAASFQEVSRVLVKSALTKKQDFLRGLHENVIVGQLIPAGTGLVTQLGTEVTKIDSFSSDFLLNSSNSLDF